MIELWTSVRWRKMEQPDDASLFSAGVSRRTIAPSLVSFDCVVLACDACNSVLSSRIWSKFVRRVKKVIGQ